jgi:hypothetical protein
VAAGHLLNISKFVVHGVREVTWPSFPGFRCSIEDWPVGCPFCSYRTPQCLANLDDLSMPAQDKNSKGAM